MIATARHITRAVIICQIESRWLTALFLAFSRLYVISLIATARHITRAVIKCQIESRWLTALFPAFSRLDVISLIVTAFHKLRGGQSRSMKPALSYCWLKLRISKSYHHLMLKSPKVTAPSFIFQPWRAVDLDKTKLVWLLMERELSLMWHCACVLFRKIDCQKFIFHCVCALFCKIDCWPLGFRILAGKSRSLIARELRDALCASSFAARTPRRSWKSLKTGRIFSI